MQTTPFGGTSAAPATRRGRPILLEAGDWILDSGDDEATVPSFRRWMQDPVFARPLGRAAGDPGDEAIRAYVRRFDRLTAHLFFVRRRHDRRPVGICQVHIDPRNRLAWMDVVIGERGREDTQHVLTEAGFAAMRWAFDEIGLDKVNVQVAESNERTGAWLARRMTLEARLRDEVVLPDGSRGTLLRYGILRTEWEALKAWRSRRIEQGGSPVVRRRHFENSSPDHRPPADGS
jgi:RimJ/RimL family protein N-acetyltransferase